jgi:hypothetical protein
MEESLNIVARMISTRQREAENKTQKMLLASVNTGERQSSWRSWWFALLYAHGQPRISSLQTIPQSIEYQMKNLRNYAHHVSNRTSAINLELDLTKFQPWWYRLG